MLMLGGITLFGAITANLAAFLLERPTTSGADSAPRAVDGDQIEALTQQVAHLTELLTAVQKPPPSEVRP